MNSITTPDVNQLWDVIVIGTGMGGATLGHALAKSGRSVLFLEAGQQTSGSGWVESATPGFGQLPPETRSKLLLRGGRVCEPVDDGEGDSGVVPFMGIGPGGSSALYGMALERFFPQDFQTWPLSYQEMEPWYEAAERLYRVRGTVDPIRQELAPHLLTPPSQSASNSAIFGELASRGLHPYRLHAGCERVDGCKLCQGYLCDRACKNDSRRICLDPALQFENTALLTETPAQSLEVQGRTVTHVVTPRAKLAGRVIVLAAGALVTPGLMPEQTNRSGCVGRYLMRHAIDLYCLTKAPSYESASDTKDLGLNDFYHVDQDLLGNVQAFGPALPANYLLNMPGRSRLSRLANPLISRIADRRARSPVVAAMLQDDPLKDNYVSGRKIHHRFGADDLRRQQRFREIVMDNFQSLGATQLWKKSKNRAGLAHACGTCRFGESPETSVLDRWNRAHEMDNLYVADASFLPTSGGLGPALTIAANALRVAEEVNRIL